MTNDLAQTILAKAWAPYLGEQRAWERAAQAVLVAQMGEARTLEGIHWIFQEVLHRWLPFPHLVSASRDGLLALLDAT